MPSATGIFTKLKIQWPKFQGKTVFRPVMPILIAVQSVPTR